MTRRRIDVNPLNALPVIIMMIAVLVGLWYLASGVFWILSYLAIVLFPLAIIINYKVVLNYGKMLLNLLKRNPLMGIAATGLSLFFYPVTCFFLFGKALLYRKVDNMKKEFENRTQGQYVEYEEIEDEEPKIIELPPRPKPMQEKQNEYEELFDDDV